MNYSTRPRRHNYGSKSCKQQKYMSDIINSLETGDAISNSADQQKLADFELNMSPHYEAIRRACIGKTRNEALGEELAQTVIMKAFKYWHTYQDQGKGPMSWINKIIQNAYYSQSTVEGKHNKNRVALKADIDDDWQDDFVQNNAVESQLGASAESIVISQLDNEEILAAIQSIDPVFRAVALLNIIDGWKYKEIAEFTGIPANTVGTQVHRARGLLSSALRQKAIEYGIDPDSRKKKKK
jgi:RNA polymerase sigma-70 factor (ECF subfamily)